MLLNTMRLYKNRTIVLSKRRRPKLGTSSKVVKLSRNFVDPSSAHVSAGGGHSPGANLWIVIIMAWLLIAIMGTYTCIYTADT